MFELGSEMELVLELAFVGFAELVLGLEWELGSVLGSVWVWELGLESGSLTGLAKPVW